MYICVSVLCDNTDRVAAKFVLSFRNFMEGDNVAVLGEIFKYKQACDDSSEFPCLSLVLLRRLYVEVC